MNAHLSVKSSHYGLKRSNSITIDKRTCIRSRGHLGGEHVPEGGSAECKRMLKTGGVMIIIVIFQFWVIILCPSNNRCALQNIFQMQIFSWVILRCTGKKVNGCAAAEGLLMISLLRESGISTGDGRVIEERSCCTGH